MKKKYEQSIKLTLQKKNCYNIIYLFIYLQHN